jgi:hypothetical protein
MTDNTNSMPEKIIIESKIISEKNESNADELSLSQGLLEDSQVEKKPIDNIDMSEDKKKDCQDQNSDPKKIQKIKRYF